MKLVALVAVPFAVVSPPRRAILAALLPAGGFFYATARVHLKPRARIVWIVATLALWSLLMLRFG